MCIGSFAKQTNSGFSGYEYTDMFSKLIKNATLINEGSSCIKDVLIQ